MVLPDAARTTGQRAARAGADQIAAEGPPRAAARRRSAEADLRRREGAGRPAGQLVPRALVVLAERIREDAAETMRYFTEQGVALKVISGDNPRTVGAVAAAVGVPGASSAPPTLSTPRTLPDDIDELADVLEQHSVFGRVTPQQKRAVVGGSAEAAGTSSR